MNAASTKSSSNVGEHMIEEVINSILQAEDEAKRRVEAAQVKASEIIAQAETQAENIRHTATADNKKYQQQRLTDADAQIAQEAQQLQAERKVQTDNEVAKLQQNVDETVKFILESL